MKTVEETVKELYQLDVIQKSDRIPEKFIEAIEKSNSIKKLEIEAFKAGVEFSQRWIPIEEELPPLSQKVLCKDSTVFDVYLFESNIDRDIKIEVCSVTHWRPIELK